MSDPSSHLAESGLTMHSDSEQYASASPEEGSTSSSPVILYKPPSVWGLLRGTAINLVLPFINGMMLGFGELFAHEAAFRLGWGGTKVHRPLKSWLPDWLPAMSTANCSAQVFPVSRRKVHSIGPGLEIREKPTRPTTGLNDLTSLE